jgi:membrane fusion protein (multidrug efflux system)
VAARRAQDYAVIRAPVDGTVGALQVRRGDVVQPGSAMMALVPLDRMYVLAYFKETQSARIVAGQRVPVRIAFDRGQQRWLAQLRPGLSVTAQVAIGEQ